eukprot:scaffold45284_cov15-Tisochrysis_lutea.AAC.2
MQALVPHARCREEPGSDQGHHGAGSRMQTSVGGGWAAQERAGADVCGHASRVHGGFEISVCQGGHGTGCHG